MGCCLSAEEREQQRISQLIDMKLEENRKQASKKRVITFTVLVLGTRESGKTTFIKQMRLIHGYDEADRQRSRKLISQSVYKAMHSLLGGMDTLHIEFEDKRNKTRAQQILAVEPGSVETLEGHADLIKPVWNDSGLQICFDRGKEFQLMESTKHYLDALDRIAAPDYLPTMQDIVCASAPTTGVVDYPIKLAEGVTLKLVDIGRQRSEVRKWIQCFNDVTAVIFLVALSDYDQVVVESEEQNRLEESRSLFRTLISCRWLKKSALILILNKKDLLEEKIKSSHLADYFPDFQGPAQDAISAREYIFRKFAELNPDPEKTIYPYFTCAMHTENMRFVLAAVKDSILQQNLIKYRLV